MKKALLILTAFILSLAVAGCDSGDSSSKDSSSSKSDSSSLSSEVEETEATTEEEEETVDVWENNGVMITGSGEDVRAIELYGGSFKNGTVYAEALNLCKQELGDMVNVYNMCIPTAFAYYLPEQYEEEYASQYDNILNIQSQLVNVIDVDIYETLESHSDEYIYFRTDHHWQPLAAYYAAEVFAERAALDEFPDLSTYEKIEYEDFCGSLEGYAKSNELSENPDLFTYYKPANLDNLTTTYYDTDFTNPVESMLFFDSFEMKNAYSTFLGDDREIAQIDTDVENSRTLVIFKDSFGNALVPFLTQSFEHIYVCDVRYFELNAIEFCQDVGATDVLFACCMFTSTGENSALVEEIMSQ